jgi:glucose/arabinose dehydrogenase
MLHRRTTLCVLFAAALIAGAVRNGVMEADTTSEWPAIALSRKTVGLDRPTSITHAGDGSNRLFVTEQKGRIIVIKNFVPLKTPFLDITRRVSCCGERGLLSVAFPRNYRDKGYFYINYTDRSGDTVVARYRVTTDPDIADPKSEEIILSVKQPYSNHNGGQLAFGPDGFLYIGMGDGGSGGDPHGHGQNPASLLGKMLRIDVEPGAKPYRVPPANPFINKKGYSPEIWALGMRNPWRFSFDRKTGDLYIADVGQNEYEEVDFQPAASMGGENYGWNIMEGMHCYKSSSCNRTSLTCRLPSTIMTRAARSRAAWCTAAGSTGTCRASTFIPIIVRAASGACGGRAINGRPGSFCTPALPSPHSARTRTATSTSPTTPRECCIN